MLSASNIARQAIMGKELSYDTVRRRFDPGGRCGLDHARWRTG
jgi:hypothetical protein